MSTGTIDDPKALATLLRPIPAEETIAFPVSSRVGKVGENDAGLIEPVASTLG